MAETLTVPDELVLEFVKFLEAALGTLETPNRRTADQLYKLLSDYAARVRKQHRKPQG
jgi:hypothetical protein